MPAAKRARACDTCHSIKIKCELGSTGGEPPCERCTRLGKQCFISPPVRQKDKVAELEAKIEALTKLLQDQDIQVPSDASSPSSRRGAGELDGATPLNSSDTETSKKRRLDTSSRNDHRTPNHVGCSKPSDENRLELDAVVSRAVQVQILNRYHKEIQLRLSLASLTEKGDYEYLRSNHPILLQTVIYSASSGFVSTETKEDISKIVIDLLTNTETKNSLELVQALQLASFWYTMPRHHVPISMFHLMELVSSISTEISTASTTTTSSKEIASGKHINASDTWRTTIVCYLYSAYLGLLRRTPHPLTWDTNHDECLTWLEYSGYGLTTDRLLCQLVRIIWICEQISLAQHLADAPFNTNTDTYITNPTTSTQPNITTLTNKITNWKAQIPASVQCPLLKIWEHISHILIHEHVLHTTTNQQSFTAPYLADRLSLTDFPSPSPVTATHTHSLQILQQNCNALLTIVLDLEIDTIMGFSPFFILPQACYAQILLVKIYVCTTAEGNTFGLFVDGEGLTLELEGFFEGLVALGERVGGVDDRCGQARVLGAVGRVREWWVSYRESLIIQPSIVVDDFDFGSGLFLGGEGLGVTSGTNESYEWDNFTGFDESLDYGLGDMFAYTT